jgi:dCTP deaminase
MKASDLKDRLIITPILEDSQIGAGSVDLRLGAEFIVVRRGNIDIIDPARNDIKSQRSQARHLVNFGRAFYLHPNELVLASSLEYVRLPRSVAASVTTRSRWGRVGLVIATATAVHPGWTGCITLELVNHGEVPLALYPGISVAQIVLYDSKDAPNYTGRFSHQTGPKAGDVRENVSDLDFWTKREFHP